jgi:hypothetical protein
LVPFGPRAAPFEREQAPPTSEDQPPSAEDFWGERSAAIHSALQAPSDPADADLGSAEARASHLGRVDRRAVAAVAAGLVAAAVTVIALVSTALGPGRASQHVGGSKAGFAAVFSGGVASILRLDLSRIASARSTAPKVRRASHHQSARTRAHKARSRPTPAARSSVPERATATPATAAGSSAYQPSITDTTTVDSSNTQVVTQPATRPAPPPTASQAGSSRATVSPTGESGALGPVQSPNG